MSDHETLSGQLANDIAQELSPIQGESMSLGDIDRAMAELGKQFDELLLEASDTKDVSTYTERFQSISSAMEELKRSKANILNIRQEQERITRRINVAAAAMRTANAEMAEWNDDVIYQLLEKVTVLDGFVIKVTFRNGQEVERTIDQPKRRKYT